MTSPATLEEIECVREPLRAAALLQPLRVEILRRAAEPESAAEIAREIGEPRQKVNYHVRELARLRLLVAAGERPKGGLTENLWRATARSYLMAPEVVGPAAPDPARQRDWASADRLLALAAQVQSEVARARAVADEDERRLSTLSLAGELRFESAAQRAAFGRELVSAVSAVVERWSSPARDAAGEPAPGRPHRLVVGCYPIVEEDP